MDYSRVGILAVCHPGDGGGERLREVRVRPCEAVVVHAMLATQVQLAHVLTFLGERDATLVRPQTGQVHTEQRFQ